MTCLRVNNGIVCVRGSKKDAAPSWCGACRRLAPLLCDGNVPDLPGTCDLELCEGCTTRTASGKDLCPWCVNRMRAEGRLR